MPRCRAGRPLVVPPTEVAARAGNSVAVLPAVYATCIDGEADADNGRIADLLGR